MRLATRLGDREIAFRIKCDGCMLPARWFDRHIPAEVSDKISGVRLLGIEGYETPSRNLKYLPAKCGVQFETANGYKGPFLAPGSGNFSLSTKVILEENGLSNKLIAIVPSNIPDGKRLQLERKNIRIMTELDLQRELHLTRPLSTFKMLEEYANVTDACILDQYNCRWNSDSYVPIAETIWERTDGVSLFVSTAGTKGKFRVGAELKKKRPSTHLVVVYPYPGQTFPGGRNEQQGLEVANQFDIAPTAKIYMDELAALETIGMFYPDGSPGFTSGAEIAAAWKYLLQMHELGRIDELRIHGKIIVLVVFSDSIYPYLQQGMEHFPHLFKNIRDPLQ